MSDQSDDVVKKILDAMRKKGIDPEAVAVAYLCHTTKESLDGMPNNVLLHSYRVLAANLALLEIARDTGIVLGEPVNTQKDVDDIVTTIGHVDKAMLNMRNIFVERSKDFPERLQKT